LNSVTVTISELTIRDGRAGEGAGIIVGPNANVTLNDCIIGPNNVVTYAGGGIANEGGNLTLNRSTVVENHGTGSEGGAGIFSAYGTTSLINSTITGNITNNFGGGIYAAYGGTVNLIHSTVSGNTANQNYLDEPWGGGGGIYIYDATINIQNSIVAYNVDLTDPSYHTPSDDVMGTFTSLGGNLIGDGTGSSGWVGSDLVGTEAEPIEPSLDSIVIFVPDVPDLPEGPWTYGLTHYFALDAESPAVDTAPTCEVSEDQRGVSRPQGSACDIGSFELESSGLWQQLPGGESQQPSYTGVQSLYDDFVLTQTATIRQVEFWSSTAAPAMIYFGYYENTTDGSGNDIPGASISSYGNTSMVTVEDPLVCSQSYCTYRHSFMDDTTLGPGHYWIRIQGDSELYWSSAASTSGSYAYYPDGATSPTLSSGNLAFQLLEYVSPKITAIFIEPTFPGMPTWINVNFTDPDSGSHTAAVDWGDGIIDDADYCGYDYCNFPEHIYTEAGTYTVQVWVTDDQGNTGTYSTLYVVSYVMVPVSIEDWLASDTETTTIEIEGVALEGHSPLNFTIVTNPEQHGTFGIPSSSMCEFLADWGVYLCKASVVYTPPTETYLGYDYFSYTVDDGQGSFSNAAMVPLYVAPNTPPTAQSSSASVSTILPSTIILSATDPDFYNYTIDRLSAFIGTGPTQGTLGDIEKVNCYLEDPEVGEPYGICYFEVEYTPNQEITGTTDSFTFSVFDTHQYSLPGTVSIELHAPVTWTVNATDDVVDDFGCDATHCSLREAVDASWPGDIIEFNLTYPDTIILGGSDILIDKGLVINGPGADLLAISGGAEIEDLEPWTHDRVFTVGGFEIPPVTVTINGLTIRDGRADSGGGVIVLDGSNLTMNDCVIGPNNIVTYAGGGVFNERSHLTMNRCTVTGNEGTGSLGGAGVTTAYSGATTTLVNSTVSGNITNNFGGGLYVGPESVVSLINTTVSGNISNANYLDPYEERGGGAGIYIETVEGSDNLVNIQNSIIAGNIDMTDPATAGHDKWPDIYGEATSLGGNLIGDPTGSTTIWDWSDQVGDALDPLDPVLGALAWNTPGSTQTMALLTGSPAIDAAPTCEVDIDQRGVLRPQGTACDIGAYELEQSEATGELMIAKVFDPLASTFTGSFTIAYSCDDGTSGTVDLAAGGSDTITGIPLNTNCTVTEPTLPTPPTGWSFGLPTFYPETGIVTITEASPAYAEVTVTNTISRDTGTLTITKYFDPLTSGFEGTFAIDYDCDDGTAHDGTVNLAADTSETITGIPTGTICTITEPNLPTPPTGWSFGEPIFSPASGTVSVVIGTLGGSEIMAPATAWVTVTNSISRDLGELKISKVFDPLTSGFTGDFTITYDCDDDPAHDGTVTLAAGEFETISGIPTGTTCHVSEGELPAAPEGWSFNGPTYDPYNGTAVISLVPSEVVVTNTIVEDVVQTGELKITKVFDPLTSGYNGDFIVTYDCDDANHSGGISLAAGASQSVTGIPVGTTCTVYEVVLPAAPEGWVFRLPTFSPVSASVTISEPSPAYAEVVVTNAIVDVRSQVTTTRTKCSAFATKTAPDLENLLITTAYNKRTKVTTIKKVTPSAFYYYVKAYVPADASVIQIAQDRDSYPGMIPTVTLYDENCANLSPSLATVNIAADYTISINFNTSSSERIVYVGVYYTTRNLIGFEVGNPFLGMEYIFNTSLDGDLFTYDDLIVDLPALTIQPLIFFK